GAVRGLRHRHAERPADLAGGRRLLRHHDRPELALARDALGERRRRRGAAAGPLRPALALDRRGRAAPRGCAGGTTAAAGLHGGRHMNRIVRNTAAVLVLTLFTGIAVFTA